MSETIGMEIRRQDRSPIAVLESWFPMRELSRATTEEARAATMAKSLEDLSSVVWMWTRHADTVLRRAPAHAFFLIGLHERGCDEECPNGSVRLVGAEVVLTDYLAELLGIRPTVVVTFFDEFFEGLYEGIWEYQSKRLMQIATDLNLAADGGRIDVELNAERSEESDTITLSFDTIGAGPLGISAFRLAGRPGADTSTSLNRIRAVLASLPGVAIAEPRITSKAERVIQPRGLRRRLEPLAVWI
ncbi:MAG: hypothetical protein WCF44_20710 [Candidatus Methylophosphatis roskildensis]